MDIQDEINLSEQMIYEARKTNPQIGHFVKVIGKPLTGDITVQLTNGTAKINSLSLQEFKRSKKQIPIEFINQVALSFEPKDFSSDLKDNS